MMVVVFALMALTLVAGRFASRTAAMACMVVCVAATAWLFLTDVHNKDYGFGLPWLQVRAIEPPAHNFGGADA